MSYSMPSIRPVAFLEHLSIEQSLLDNLTRNIFLETGYRYFYMDYIKSGLTYDAAQSGLFTGVGVKF